MVVVTHLPQVAAFADHHVLIEKVTGAEGHRYRAARARRCRDGSRSSVRMLGGRPDDPGALVSRAGAEGQGRGGLID